MPQSNDREILAYLSQPENLPLTLEIATYAVQVRRGLLTDFWPQLDKAISDAQPSGRNAAQFVRRKIGDADEEVAGLRWVAKAAAAQDENLAVTIEHYSSKSEHSISIGLRWNSSIRPADPVYGKLQVSGLRDRLTGEGQFESSCDWWMCWRYIHQFSTLEEFLCAYVNDRAAILTPLVSAFWELAADTEGELAKINNLVAKR